MIDWKIELLGIIAVNIFLALFHIGTIAERIMIVLLGLIYWKI